MDAHTDSFTVMATGQIESAEVYKRAAHAVFVFVWELFRCAYCTLSIRDLRSKVLEISVLY